MPDERQPGRDGDPPRPDETRPMPTVEVDGAGAVTGPPPNQPSGRPRSGDAPAAETRPMTSTGEWDPDPRRADAGLWTGRAAVRPPLPEEPQYGGDDWPPAGPEEVPAGRWWMPIIVGIVALLLLGLLGYGIYLIVQ